MNMGVTQRELATIITPLVRFHQEYDYWWCATLCVATLPLLVGRYTFKDKELFNSLTFTDEFVVEKRDWEEWVRALLIDKMAQSLERRPEYQRARTLRVMHRERSDGEQVPTLTLVM